MIKELTILAVTKMYGGVCTAGIDAEGRWVRPVRPEQTIPWLQRGAHDHCLLALDFFHGGQSHLLNLGITKFRLQSQPSTPPHIEDWTLDIWRKPQLIKKLSPTEQAEFLAAQAEADLTPLLQHERSLGLYPTSAFTFHFGWNQTGEDVIVRATFTIGAQQMTDVSCTDLRMRALGRKLLAHRATAILTEADFIQHGKHATYFAIGLSRLYQGKHWPLLVGVHTLPELEVEVDYARL